MKLPGARGSVRQSFGYLGLGLFLAVATSVWVPTLIGQGRGGGGGARTDAPTRDWTQDMQMKIMQPFTLAAVGDVMIVRPASQNDNPAFQSAIKIIKDADVGYGNFESLIRDELHFTGPLSGSMNGPKEVAPDLQAMGFKVMNRAGNHIFDSNQEGMFETLRILDEFGLVYAGAGRDLEDARAPHFYEGPKGRIGLVGMFAPAEGEVSTTAIAAATYRLGNTGGRPGLNMLHTTKMIVVSPDQLAALKKIQDGIYERRGDFSNPVQLPTNEPADQIALFGQIYKAGDKPGDRNYTMNPADLREILRSVKNGKEYSDFMIASIHAHGAATEEQQWLFEDQTPDFLITLAHDAIDNGADAFAGSGPHVLRGIEIYKGKPIFYDLGEFFREWDWGCDCDADPSSPRTSAESNYKSGFSAQPVNYESAITLSKYDKGKLQQVLIYPTWGQYDAPISQRGIPEMAPPEIAQRILLRLQKLSEPFGTKIEIQGNVGVIRVAQ